VIVAAELKIAIFHKTRLKFNMLISPIIILFKKCLSASTVAIMSWQDVTRSFLCSGVMGCGTKRAHTFLFQNPKN